nr:MAG: hypothetical protein DIU72_04415 [Pseudomonadota bacterium]
MPMPTGPGRWPGAFRRSSCRARRGRRRNPGRRPARPRPPARRGPGSRRPAPCPPRERGPRNPAAPFRRGWRRATRAWPAAASPA